MYSVHLNAAETATTMTDVFLIHSVVVAQWATMAAMLSLRATVPTSTKSACFARQAQIVILTALWKGSLQGQTFFNQE